MSVFSCLLPACSFSITELLSCCEVCCSLDTVKVVVAEVLGLSTLSKAEQQERDTAASNTAKELQQVRAELNRSESVRQEQKSYIVEVHQEMTRQSDEFTRREVLYQATVAECKAKQQGLQRQLSDVQLKAGGQGKEETDSSSDECDDSSDSLSGSSQDTIVSQLRKYYQYYTEEFAPWAKESISYLENQLAAKDKELQEQYRHMDLLKEELHAAKAEHCAAAKELETLKKPTAAVG